MPIPHIEKLWYPKPLLLVFYNYFSKTTSEWRSFSTSSREPNKIIFADGSASFFCVIACNNVLSTWLIPEVIFLSRNFYQEEFYRCDTIMFLRCCVLYNQRLDLWFKYSIHQCGCCCDRSPWCVKICLMVEINWMDHDSVENIWIYPDLANHQYWFLVLSTYYHSNGKTSWLSVSTNFLNLSIKSQVMVNVT